MSLQALEVIASVGGLLLATVALPIVYRQLRDMRRAISAAAHAAIYQQAADLRAHLVEHPHLRRYFFDGAELTPEDENYDRVITIAELFLNYLEHMTVMAAAFGDENRPSLERFCATALDRSPVLRERLANGHGWYSDALLRTVDAAGRRADRPANP